MNAAMKAKIPFSFLARPQLCNFTRAYKKIVLTKDVDNLGFAGEICFVKPGHALNNLVPRREALFFTDPKANKFIADVDVSFFLSLSNFVKTYCDVFLVGRFSKEAVNA